MSHQFLVTKEVSGVELVEFNPNSAMMLFSMYAFCDKGLAGKRPEVICEAIGIPVNSYNNFQKYNPYFEEWLEKRRLELGGKSKRAALEAVGMERALAGEFNFWKALSIREGVIDPDKLEIGANLPANLGAFKGMSNDELNALENSTMASLRGEGVSGEIAMVEGPLGWEREGDSGGTTQVPRSLALHDEVGPNGKSSLSELESF